MKPRPISPALQEFVGAPEISRTQALKVIWAHIKANNLQVFSRNFFSFVLFWILMEIFVNFDNVHFLYLSFFGLLLSLLFLYSMIFVFGDNILEFILFLFF